MSLDLASPRTRRALLAAALGAGAATVASAVGRPLPASAADGQAVFVGGAYTATSATAFHTGQSGATALYGDSGSTGQGVGGTSNLGDGVHGVSTSGSGVHGYSFTGPGVRGVSNSNSGVNGTSTSGRGVRGLSESNTGVYGSSTSDVGVYGDSSSGDGVFGFSSTSSGVAGESPDGLGVYGLSPSGTGVRGTSTAGSGVTGNSSSGYGVAGNSTSHAGVYGSNLATDRPAIIGIAQGANTGVLGYSGAPGSLPAAPVKTGVYGYAVQDANSRGVTGRSTSGRGIDGVATSGTGVYASATTGYALRAAGRVKLDNCSGLATIASGTKSVVVTPGIDLTTSSAVVATLQASAGGTTTVHRCVVNGPANTFTIYLTANAVSATKVAWHVFG